MSALKDTLLDVKETNMSTNSVLRNNAYSSDPSVNQSTYHLNQYFFKSSHLASDAMPLVDPSLSQGPSIIDPSLSTENNNSMNPVLNSKTSNEVSASSYDILKHYDPVSNMNFMYRDPVSVVNPSSSMSNNYAVQPSVNNNIPSTNNNNIPSTNNNNNINQIPQQQYLNTNNINIPSTNNNNNNNNGYNYNYNYNYSAYGQNGNNNNNNNNITNNPTNNPSSNPNINNFLNSLGANNNYAYNPNQYYNGQNPHNNNMNINNQNMVDKYKKGYCCVGSFMCFAFCFMFIFMIIVLTLASGSFGSN